VSNKGKKKAPEKGERDLTTVGTQKEPVEISDSGKLISYHYSNIYEKFKSIRIFKP
jgi:hypothetical protein